MNLIPVGAITTLSNYKMEILSKCKHFNWHGSCSVIYVMFIKRILKIGLVAIVASALTTLQAQPAPKPDKPDKERPEKGKWNKRT
jgi:hypothetical protein